MVAAGGAGFSTVTHSSRDGRQAVRLRRQTMGSFQTGNPLMTIRITPENRTKTRTMNRRRFLGRFLGTTAASAALTLSAGIARPYLSRAADRPLITHGVQSGDVSVDGGVVWARADRPSRMLVEVATTESFKDVRRAVFVD